MKRKFKIAALVSLTATMLLLGSTAALAEDVDSDISEALAAVPGGEIIDAHTAYWPALDMTLTVPDLRLRDAIGTCPNGSVCAFSAATLGGKRLSWTTCGTVSPAALGSPVRSIADARSTGRFEARDGTTVLAVAYAQSWDNVTGTTTSLVCY